MTFPSTMTVPAIIYILYFQWYYTTTLVEVLCDHHYGLINHMTVQTVCY